MSANRAVKTVQSFCGDRRGGVAIIFALLLVPMVLMIGSGIDYSRSLNAKTGLGNALDAAVLVGANKMVREGGKASEVEDAVKNAFEAGIQTALNSGAKIKTLTVHQDPSIGEVKVNATVSLPTSFMNIIGVSSIDVENRSAARLAESDIEVAMMLDLTGSMSGSKINDLKIAAKDLVDILLSGKKKAASNKIRIGLVPYSQGVNAGSYASIATNGASNKCVTERTTGNQYNDKSYSKTPIGNGSYACPSSKIFPLTDNSGDLKKQIDGFSTTGWTAGHTGISWAWYLLSPNWKDLWPAGSDPASYKDKETVKIAILMTDGEFNTAYDYNSGKNTYVESKGTAKSKSEQRAAKLCNKMKRKGITIYSVTFKLNSQSGKKLMENCASDTTKFYDADNGESLKTAFAKIAADISQLRLSE